jgi:uncharacterized protein
VTHAAVVVGRPAAAAVARLRRTCRRLAQSADARHIRGEAKGFQMEHISDALAEEFSGKEAVIHKLKTASAHFRRLLEDNEHLFRDIHRMQTNVEPVDDATWETYEKRRLKVLDEIAAMISAVEAEGG